MAANLTVEIEGDYDPVLAGIIQQEVELGVRSLQHNQPDMSIGFFRSALSKVSPDFPFVDHISHNLLLAHKQRIEQLFAQERGDDALALVNDALALEITGSMANDALFLRAFADAVHGLGLKCFQNLQFEACVRCCRRALSISRSAAYSVNLTNALSVLRQPMILSDLTTTVSPELLGNHIFIACVPKSASTFLKNVLVDLTGYRDVFAVFAAGQNEHDLYAPALIESAGVNTVTQQHCRASEGNIQIMQALGIRPVVLVRNIHDAIVSQLDFYRQGAFFNSYFRADFQALDDETQIDLLIDNLVPWYLQFVSSWQLAEREGRLDVKWLSYEELVANKDNTITDVLGFYGLGAAKNDILRSISSTETASRQNRFNKGVVGRGRKGLTAEQKSRIILLTRYHPSAEFSQIGL